MGVPQTHIIATFFSFYPATFHWFVPVCRALRLPYRVLSGWLPAVLKRKIRKSDKCAQTLNHG